MDTHPTDHFFVGLTTWQRSLVSKKGSLPTTCTNSLYNTSLGHGVYTHSDNSVALEGSATKSVCHTGGIASQMYRVGLRQRIGQVQELAKIRRRMQR